MFTNCTECNRVFSSLVDLQAKQIEGENTMYEIRCQECGSLYTAVVTKVHGPTRENFSKNLPNYKKENLNVRS